MISEVTPLFIALNQHQSTAHSSTLSSPHPAQVSSLICNLSLNTVIIYSHYIVRIRSCFQSYFEEMENPFSQSSFELKHELTALLHP